jgi:hypothetical protein
MYMICLTIDPVNDVICTYVMTLWKIVSPYVKSWISYDLYVKPARIDLYVRTLCDIKYLLYILKPSLDINYLYV